MKELDTSISSSLKAFKDYNHYKKGIMYRCDPTGSRVILEFLPLLIHINHPSLPGYISQENCPCGIKYMEWPVDTIREIRSYLASRVNLGNMQDYVPRQFDIEGLFIMGSVGSLAQTRGSDYDIWVVINARGIDPDRKRVLEKKLKSLQRWISGKYVLDIHFFLMDIGDIRSNNFGEVSQEGSGSALKGILKEEFYRTMTLIEGRVPLWWVVPPDSGPEGYDRVRSLVNKDHKASLKGYDFLDLGDIESIPEQELLGGALWQMHKALDDPLKSVLKMALVATYLDSSTKDKLLCNVLKKDVFNAAKGDIVDPYVQILRRVEDHFGAKGDYKTVDLLRRCFYLKVSPNIKGTDLLRLDRDDKTSIMVDIVKSWGWSLHTIKELNEFSEWGVERYRRLGDDIHAYLKLTTVQLIRKAKAYLVNSALDEDVEVEVLRRRVEAFYVSKEGKIESEKRVKKKEPAYRDLFFTYKKGIWSIFERFPDMGKASPIMESDRVVKILAWLAYNKRFDASTSFHMIPNASKAVFSDIQSLLWMLNTVIPDANSIGLDRSSLVEDKYAKFVVIVGNLECPDSHHSIHEVDMLYINTWNELFCISLKPEQIMGWMGRMKRSSTQIKIWLPRGSNTEFLTRRIASLIT